MRTRRTGLDSIRFSQIPCGLRKLFICTILLIAPAAEGATIPIVASDDATVYDLVPNDGSADSIEFWQYGLEAGTAYFYYRDGRVAKGLLLFNISTLSGYRISAASFFTTVWSFRIGSSFDVYGFHADSSLHIENWDTPSSFVGRSGDVMNQPARMPFEFDVTSLMQSAIGSHWEYLGIRLEEGGSQTVDPFVGFIGTQWPPDVLITYPYHYPRLSVSVEEIPEPSALLMIATGFSLFAVLLRHRQSEPGPLLRAAADHQDSRDSRYARKI